MKTTLSGMGSDSARGEKINLKRIRTNRAEETGGEVAVNCEKDDARTF